MEVSPEVTIVKQCRKMLLSLLLKGISKFEEKNVNKYPQSEMWKKEKLHSSEQFANQGNSLQRKLQVRSPDIKGRQPFIEKVPALVPDWSIFVQMRNPNYTVLIGPNSLVPLD